ncbi:MAG: BamA/TamA family outer membrane protein [Ekhidna sp.]|nr:BamA/TamA family outer membrane protein [Ekhidna sp.]
MRKNLTILLFILPILLFPQKVFLIGDAGEPQTPDKTFELLKEKIRDASEEDVLIFLGDNLYPKGLPDREDPERTVMEEKLVPQLEIMKTFRGKAFIIPGNHDWAKGERDGYARVLNMEKFIKAYFEGEDVFLPVGGCPGPVEVPINDKFTTIIVNTQYFLHPWDKPDEQSECPNKSTIEALQEITEVVKRNKGKHILIAAHHPMFTYGEHNGNFNFKQQLLPLPVLGSIQPLFRKTIGGIQDNTHPKYKAIMKQILSGMDEAEHVIYAAGHEHSLQLIEKEGHHFIVSGSGSKTTHVRNGKGSKFSKSENGFAILDLTDEGRASVKFWGKENGLLYEQELYKKELFDPNENITSLDFSDSTVTVVASRKYQGKKGRNIWLGKNYRDVWSQPVEVEVFNIGKERGGLEVVKKGGGMQTKSLRMKAENDKEYVLRSIEKYPENAIPPALRKTFAQDIVEDQISASHPYAAFIVPYLAEPVGIYHTNPKPVFIPSDPRFGQFQSTFEGMLALYEERPNEAAASDPFFGGGEDVDGTLTVIENLKEDNDVEVDQNFVVRNRLFDMWIGDWDRHDDQWRWAQFDKKGGKIYRPIPRDRDQVFFINEGIIPSLTSRKWGIPKIEGFDEEVRWAPGISQNARFFDRTFMNEPEWSDWENEIEFLQKNLTDEVIENAIAQWPDEIQQLTADRIRTGLKARRSDMPRYARELYLYLSKEVEVTGSDKHEYFLVEHLNEAETKVTVRKRKKDGELKQVIYERIFRSDETREVRLYGFDGEDIFEVKGNPNPGVKIRIIGGTDKDLIINGNGDEKLKKVKVYDRVKSTKVEGNDRGILRLSTNPEINRYDRKAFEYDVLFPLVLIATNPDEGLAIGGGFAFTKHAWRKKPFASNHSFSAVSALATDAFAINYKATFTDVFGKWDLKPQIALEQPFGVNNFFGLGNTTAFREGQFRGSDDNDIDYYRYQLERIETDLDLVKNIGALGNLTIGGGYRSVKVNRNENRFIVNEFIDNDGTDNYLFNTNNYLKGRIGADVDTRTNKIMPQSGMTASANVEHFEAMTDLSQSFTRLSADWSFYLGTKLPSSIVFANRLGVAHNVGDFEFFNANVLGGRENLRGFRRNRFHGETFFYHNLDVRIKLFSFRSYIFPGQFGILGFHDVGRVWIDNEDSDTWHTGKGFGVWLSPVNMFVLNFNYGFSDDGTLPSFYLGFFF